MEMITFLFSSGALLELLSRNRHSKVCSNKEEIQKIGNGSHVGDS